MLVSDLLEDVEDFVDVEGVLKQWTSSLGSWSGHDLLDLHERTVDQLSELEVQAAMALEVPGLVAAVRRRAEAMRRLTRAYTSLARAVLPA